MAEASGWAAARPSRLRALLPGVGLCAIVAAVADLLARLEAMAFGAPGLGGVMWALVLGILLRTIRAPDRACDDGIAFSARRLLEIAVMLFGALLSTSALLELDPLLAAGIPVVVLATIAASYGGARLLGVAPRLAALIAAGNAVCGNSAIAAARPVTGASPAEASVAIALTSVPAIAVTLALPLAAASLDLGPGHSGALAGLMVYAIPQVFGAAAPMGALSLQVGLVVKLTRVLTLGPAMMLLALLLPHGPRNGRAILSRMLPWYMLGFAALLLARTIGLFPEMLVPPVGATAHTLAMLAMAALGLQTDLSAIRRLGLRELGAVALSLTILASLSLTLLALV